MYRLFLVLSTVGGPGMGAPPPSAVEMPYTFKQKKECERFGNWEVVEFIETLRKKGVTLPPNLTIGIDCKKVEPPVPIFTV